MSFDYCRNIEKSIIKLSEIYYLLVIQLSQSVHKVIILSYHKVINKVIIKLSQNYRMITINSIHIWLIRQMPQSQPTINQRDSRKRDESGMTSLNPIQCNSRHEQQPHNYQQEYC